MTTSLPTRLLHPTPLRVATVTLCLMLGGCTVVGDWIGGDHADYKAASKRTQPLEVPPDLTQLQRDSRYLPQGGVVAASDLSRTGGATADAGAPAPAAQPGNLAPATPTVALNAVGDVHIERQGERRWLVAKQPPEVVLPKVRQYWLSHGYTLTVDDPATGILETDWKENRAKMPGSYIRDLLGKVVDGLFDSGLRDRYRTRLERGADGTTEIYVTQFGTSEEVVGTAQNSDTKWVPRPNDPGLEAEQLSQIMLALGGVPDTNLAAAQAASASSFSFFKDEDEKDTKKATGLSTEQLQAAAQVGGAAGTGPNGTARARLVAGQSGAAMQVDDNFDRAWRRIGLALDHGGFTVEDRDRAQGLYYVRYVDAKEAAKDEPGFFSKFTSWFGHEGPSPVNKYRIAIKAPGESAMVTVLNDQGQPDNSDNARHIVALLVDELK